MPLTSQLLSGDTRLQSAANNQPPLRMGERGQAIVLFQTGLLFAGMPLPVSTGEMSKAPDGIFGRETDGAVRSFQRSHSLGADGIPGRNTMTHLDEVVRAGVTNAKDLAASVKNKVVEKYDWVQGEDSLSLDYASRSLDTAGAHLAIVEMLGGAE